MSGPGSEGRFVVVAETRRRWSHGEKLAMVAETATSTVSAVARQHNIAASLLFRWRRELAGKEAIASNDVAQSFVPVALPAPAGLRAAPAPAGMMEIELLSGRRLRVDGSVDTGALKRVVDVLER